MAKKATAKKTTSGRTTDSGAKAIDAAFRLAALQGWHHTTLADVAAEAKLPLAALYDLYPSKAALLADFSRRIDAKMLAGADVEDFEESPRERLFDVVMRRFDALAPYREGLGVIVRELPRDPATALCFSYGPFRRTLTWMLEAAGIESGGLRGLARVKGLALIYLGAMRVWLDDESEDKARTMAALDRSLKRAESLIGMLAGRRRARPGEEEPTI